MTSATSCEVLSPRCLDLDPAAEVERTAAAVRDQVFGQLRRRGAVVGLSGGIDSSVAAALCVRALGADKVLGLLMPERECSAESMDLGRLLADRLGIDTVTEDITQTLEATGCYRRRDKAIGGVFPQYGPGYKSKIVLPNLFDGGTYRVFYVVVESPDGIMDRARLPLAAYREVVAASNFKQRVRKMFEYYHADRLRYAVVGTPNRLEYDQGFFVKNGDGAADVKPIAHLYKTQVYQLAGHLGVPDEICRRPPTTDTYSMVQSQEEFFFSLPYDILDLCLFAMDHDMPCEAVAEAAELTSAQVARVYQDIEAKRTAARYLHAPPLSAAPVGNDELHDCTS